MVSDRKVTSGKSLLIVLCVAMVLLSIDYKTQFLKSSRAVLSYALTPVSWVASMPSRFFGGVDNFLENEPEIENAYEHLRVEYVKLKSDMLRRNAVERENTQLRALLGISQRSGVSMQIASPVEIDLDPYQHRVLVSKGAASGIFIGQPVLDDKGVIGQVSEVFRASSVVTLITDPAHTVPVKIQRNGRHILAEGSGDLTSLRIPFLNKNVDIVVGDVLETSGLGSRFPVGYPVGVVDTITTVEGDAFLSISARPVAAVESLNYMLFMSELPSSDIKPNAVDALNDSVETTESLNETSSELTE